MIIMISVTKKLINIKNFNSNNLKLDKKGVLGNDVYYIGYITKKNTLEC